MGPLAGITIIELAGIGPAPFAGMMLADMGARVIRVERAADMGQPPLEPVSVRGKESVALDLKSDQGRDIFLQMVDKADVLIDPFRPGKCEALGIGPSSCMARNSRLVFARMTGWGQEGPLAHVAGHDINYIALTGALHAMPRLDGIPAIPLNLIGDMGGGGMLLVNGILAALLERTHSGKGQTIDVAMVDGTAQMMSLFHGLVSTGLWDSDKPGQNLLDGGHPFYNTYACADGRFIAIGAIEPQFQAELLKRLELDGKTLGNLSDPAQWQGAKEVMAELFMTRSQSEWCELLNGSDACFAPVIPMQDAASYPANIERAVYSTVDDMVQPSPAPRFGRTPSQIRHGAHKIGADTNRVLTEMGIPTPSGASNTDPE